jgi:hypothetical protein
MFGENRHTITTGYYLWRDEMVSELFSTLTQASVDVGYGDE